MYPENEVTSSEGFEPVIACRRFEKGGTDVGSEDGASIRRRRADGLAGESAMFSVVALLASRHATRSESLLST